MFYNTLYILPIKIKADIKKAENKTIVSKMSSFKVPMFYTPNFKATE